MAKAKDRQAKSRKAKKERGGRQVSAWLDLDASDELKKLTDAGETIGGILNSLLHQSRFRGK